MIFSRPTLKLAARWAIGLAFLLEAFLIASNHAAYHKIYSLRMMEYYQAESLGDMRIQYCMFVFNAMILMSGILVLANERCGLIMAMGTVLLHLVVIHVPNNGHKENVREILICFLALQVLVNMYQRIPVSYHMGSKENL